MLLTQLTQLTQQKGDNFMIIVGAALALLIALCIAVKIWKMTG